MIYTPIACEDVNLGAEEHPLLENVTRHLVVKTQQTEKI
jgi:hypothetical protein